MNMIVDWGTALKIWAVLGPLIAGGASAIWARQNQIQDREHDLLQQKLARDQSHQDREFEFKRNVLSSRRAELRAALTQLVAASNDYISLCQNNETIHGNAETKRLELDTLARVNASYQTVSILGTEEINSLASNIVNIATDFPYEAPGLSEEERREHHKNYIFAKENLATAARKFFGIESEA